VQSRKVEILVGCFLLASIFSLAVLAIRVSGFSLKSASDSYPLYCYFEEVGGLSERSKVAISGVAVGQVTSVAYSEETLNARVTIEIDSYIDSIPIDSTASILTEGLLGSKYVSISLGAEDEVLMSGDEIFDTQSAVILEDLIGKFLLDQF